MPNKKVSELPNTTIVSDSDDFLLNRLGTTSTIKYDTIVSNISSKLDKNFIKKPTSASDGQVLTYNQTTSTWIASAVPTPTSESSNILTVSEPAIGLGVRGWSHYNGSYYTKNQFYYFGYPYDANPPRRALFFDNYLLKNPSLKIVKTLNSCEQILLLLSDGTLWATGQIPNIQNIYDTIDGFSYVFLKLNSMFSNKSVKDFSFSSTGERQTCIGILCTDGSAYAWGYNAHGQLGTGNKTSSETPISVGITGKTIAQIAVAGSNSYGNILLRMTDGTVYASGLNAHGQLGVGDTTERTTFTQCKETATTFLTNVSAICETSFLQDGYTRFIIKNDGTLWGAGLNNASQLADGTSVNSVFFKKINGVTNVRKVVTAGRSSTTTVAALDSSGSVYTWGNSSHGATGQGVSTDILSPLKVSVYRDTPKTTAPLPTIKDIAGTTCTNVGCIGLISTSKQLFTAGHSSFTPVSIFSKNNSASTSYYRFELVGIENVEEVVFYANESTSGGGSSTGTIVRDSGGIIWSWGSAGGNITHNNNTTYFPSRINY